MGCDEGKTEFKLILAQSLRPAAGVLGVRYIKNSDIKMRENCKIIMEGISKMDRSNLVIETIKNRRSTRKYSNIPINDDDLKTIIEAGLMAPSAHNNKGWHFTVISNQELMQKMNIETKEISKNCGDELYERWGNNDQFNIFYDSPIVIVLSGDDSAYNSYIDCAAATQNMLLAAESLNIGTCWIGIIELLFRKSTDEYSELLGLPENYTPLFAMTVGNKAGKESKPPALDKSVVKYIK